MLPRKNPMPGPVGPRATSNKNRMQEKFHPGERTAAQIRFENEQSHERISQIDKMGRHPAAQNEPAESRPSSGDLTR